MKGLNLHLLVTGSNAQRVFSSIAGFLSIGGAPSSQCRKWWLKSLIVYTYIYICTIATIDIYIYIYIFIHSFIHSFILYLFIFICLFMCRAPFRLGTNSGTPKVGSREMRTLDLPVAWTPLTKLVFRFGVQGFRHPHCAHTSTRSAGLSRGLREWGSGVWGLGFRV